MNQEERNKRKQKWMAHGFGISKRFKESGENIAQILLSVRDGGSEFDAFTQILEEIETTLHECGIAAFTEKFLIFTLADQEMKNAKTL